jgi:hypothetical protein
MENITQAGFIFEHLNPFGYVSNDCHHRLICVGCRVALDLPQQNGE